MNKSALLLLAFISVAFGSVIYLQQQKIAELERLYASARRGQEQLAAESEQHRSEAARLAKDADAFKAESEQLRAQWAKAKEPSPGKPAAAGSQDSATPAPGSTAGAGKAWMKGLSKMFTDPEMKKSMRMQQMMGMRMIYGDLAKQLNLSAEDAEQVMEMLTDRQMDISAAAMANADGDGKAAQGQKVAETQKQYGEKLKAILGDDRYSKLQAYESTIGDRFMLQQFEGQFAASGAPLQSAQKDKLLALIQEERGKLPADTFKLGNNANPQAQMEALKSDQAIADYATGQETLNRRVLDRARDLLSADQVATLEKVQRQQVEMMKAQAKMSREFLGLGK